MSGTEDQPVPAEPVAAELTPPPASPIAAAPVAVRPRRGIGAASFILGLLAILGDLAALVMA